MADFLISNNTYFRTASACVVDLVPPTFAGLVLADVESRGQVRCTWAAGTDVTNPIRYEVYVQASTATGLFNTNNIAGITNALSYDVFTLAGGGFLQNGTTYHFGVRAVDAVGNRESNTISQGVISTGVLTSIDIYETLASWSSDAQDDFRITAWAIKNSSAATPTNAVMGSASYQIFDKSGALVTGMSGTVMAPTAEGLYIFPAVSNILQTRDAHYELRISIEVDGEGRVNFTRIAQVENRFNIDGIADVDPLGQLVGSFWVNGNAGTVTTDLGIATWQLYTASGQFTGIQSPSPITADVNGFFTVPAFPFPGPLDTTQAYIVKVSTEVGGEVLSANIPTGNDAMSFDTRAGLSINASNQFEASFWAVRNDQQAPAATLGTASYTVYDKAGVAVSGLTESGITADVNGYYHITPVSAALLTDLGHYKIKVSINVQGQLRVNTHVFTLLGN